MEIADRNKTMLSQRERGSTLSEIARGVGLSTERTRQIILKEMRRRDEVNRQPRVRRMSTRLRNALIYGLEVWHGKRLRWAGVSDAEIIDVLNELGLLYDGGAVVRYWPNIGKTSLKELREFVGWEPPPEIDPPAEVGLIEAIKAATNVSIAENNPGEDWDRYERAMALSAAEATLKWFADRAKSKVARGVFENALAEAISLYYDPFWPTTADVRRSLAFEMDGRTGGKIGSEGAPNRHGGEEKDLDGDDA